MQLGAGNYTLCLSAEFTHRQAQALDVWVLPQALSLIRLRSLTLVPGFLWDLLLLWNEGQHGGL